MSREFDGKTVFITSLVHALTKGARLPVFEAENEGRILKCYLEPQPDDDLPRMHVALHDPLDLDQAMRLEIADDRQIGT